MDKKLILRKYIIYGLLGICMEVFFTGFFSLLRSDFTLEGNSYIWMFFIYGLAVFLEPIHNMLRGKNIILRGIVYMLIIYLVEYVSGYLLQVLIGQVPWYYTGIGSINGLINLTFIPVWFILGLIYERVHDYLDKILKRVYR